MNKMLKLTTKPPKDKGPKVTPKTPDRTEIEDLLVAIAMEEARCAKRMELGAGTAASTFGEALNKNLITAEQYELARKRAGRLWSYRGD